MGIVTISMAATSIYADCKPSMCQNVDITRLFVTSYGSMVVGTSGDESKLNCTAPGNANVTVSNTVGQKAIYSMLLTAKTTKTKVTLRIEEGSSNCKVLYVY